MEHREPGWYPDPWQDGLERRWDGARWTGDVRGPSDVQDYAQPGADDYVPGSDERGDLQPGVAEDYTGPTADTGPPPSRISDAERITAAHEGRSAGHPTFAGMPYGRYDDDPKAMRTTRGLIRALWVILIAFGVLLVIWGISRLF